MNLDRLRPVWAYLTQSNLVTALLVVFVVTGLAKVLGVGDGDLTLAALVNLLDVQVAAYGIGAGLASLAFKRAAPGEPVLGFAALLVFAYAVTGAVQVFADDLTFEAYLKTMDLPFAGLAIGKGLFANNG